MIDDYIGVVLLAPLFGESPVKPGVISGNKVAPLQNLERFLLRRGALRKQECRPERSSSNSTGPGNFHEISSAYTLALLLFLHVASSVCFGRLHDNRRFDPRFYLAPSHQRSSPKRFTSSGTSFVTTGRLPCTITRICS